MALSSLVVRCTVLVSTLHSGVGLVMPNASYVNHVPGVDNVRGTNPHLVALRRESSPVRRHGKVASFKTSYSGTIRVGTPAQEFRVVFDTGSGHIVLPAHECTSETCMKHERFDISKSLTAVAINADGSVVADSDVTDQIAIGYGSGEVTGEFVRDQVCVGEGDQSTCVVANVVMAIEMSPQPFKSFNFDGIVGLGLSNLALADSFSYFNMLAGGNQLDAPHFGVFLSEGEEGEESEIAFGGHNPTRLLEPLHWVPVAMPELGYWEVSIKAIRIDGRELEVCKDGTCRGVVDTGTSHLGVPAPYNVEVSQLLTQDAGDLFDCRLVQAPEVEIELPGMNLTLNPRNYMRRLPLRDGVTVGSPTGVVLEDGQPQVVVPTQEATQQLVAPADAYENLADVKRQCTPKVTRVNLPEPLGPKLFILGEPVLHRYYTVYDWEKLQVGFGLSNSRQNTQDLSSSGRGELPDEVEMLLMQETVQKLRRQSMHSDGDDDEDEMLFIQVTISVVIQRSEVSSNDPCMYESASPALAIDM